MKRSIGGGFFLILVAVSPVCFLCPDSILGDVTYVNVSKTPYRIGPSDLLDIQVWNEPDISKQVRVLLDGTIVLPLIGKINAAGITPSDLSQLVKKKLAKFISEPEVTVLVLEQKHNRYFVLGQIQNPGEYFIDYPITILQALARAGGFLEWAKKSRIFLVRPTREGGKRLEFNYDEFVKGNKKVKNIEIMAGDTIIVP